MRGALAVSALALAAAAPASARPLTTNAPAIFQSKVTLTDRAVRLTPRHAARGSIVTFIITNRGKMVHRFQLGDVKRGPGHGEGFARTLKPDQQVTIVMYLNYRGVLGWLDRTGKRAVARGDFRVT